MMTDLILKGGEVIDPSRSFRGKADIAVENGMITAVGESIEPNGHTRVLDVSGKLVTPGLVDLHAHVYDGVTESGLEADIAGVKSGVTTLLDAGSSGSQTFDGLRRYVVSHAQTRIFCLVHIASLGLANMPEIRDRDDIDLEETIRVVQSNKPLVKGVKVRATGPGVVSLGLEMIELAKTAAVEGGVPLMVHIGDRFHEGDGPVLTQGLLPLLEAGDIVTHLYTGNAGRIIDDSGDLLPEVIEARERGVILDAAHGRQNFSFDVAKRALDAGLAPDTISSDLTGPGRRGVVHSLLSIMGRFIALGLPLEDVIRRTTVNPARVLGIDHAAGSLAPGRPADVAVLEQVSGNWVFPDADGGKLKGTTALVPVVTLKDGDPVMPDWGPRPWGWLPETDCDSCD